MNSNAEEEFTEAEKIIKDHLKSNDEYLKSVILINKGRHILDNRIIRKNVSPKDYFLCVLKIYKKAKSSIKDELAEIAALAHNNLGVYYLNEGLYERAEEELIKAIDLNAMSSHARYNLGVLYQRRGEEDTALLLIRNAYNLNPKFDEAKEALRKLSAQEKKTGLGAEWFDWWFETIIVKKKRKKEHLEEKCP